MSRIAILVTTAALLATEARADEPVRVATWNVQGIGAPGTADYASALDVLNRIGADVVGICEIASVTDVANFKLLAADAGYTEMVIAAAPPFGASRCGFLSVLPIVSSTDHTAAGLSRDSTANDLSRTWTEIVVEVGTGDLLLATTHFKSGTSNADEFRRAVEASRGAQLLAGLDPDVDAYVVMGDFNADVGDAHAFPASFTAAPTVLPTGFVVGKDITATLAAGGLDNDPFAQLDGLVEVVDAVQVDGSDATRPSSGRRLDYLFASPALAANGIDAEVYDSADESLTGGLDKFGSAPASATSTDASDHYLVFADVSVPTDRADYVLINQVGYDTPGDDAKEEFVELYNPTAAAVSLDGWTVSDNTGSWTIPSGTAIAAGDTLSIARNAAGFKALYGVYPDVAGLTRSLSNTADEVVLTDDTGAEIDHVAWGSYVAGWTLAAGTGDALVRVDARVDSDNASDWTSAAAGPR